MLVRADQEGTPSQKQAIWMSYQRRTQGFLSWVAAIGSPQQDFHEGSKQGGQGNEFFNCDDACVPLSWVSLKQHPGIVVMQEVVLLQKVSAKDELILESLDDLEFVLLA
jgi:hypothetical protein